MAGLARAARRHYAATVGKPPEETGPWGAAIQYWLDYERQTQADLMRLTGLRKNTISRAKRGYHTTTRVLEKIAQAFKVRFEDILVSPVHRAANEERRRIATDVAERILRDLDLSDPRTRSAIERELASGFQHYSRATAQMETLSGSKKKRPKAARRPTRRRKRAS
jgi:transcriptional regulator with XRE-family HTH domain